MTATASAHPSLDLPDSQAPQTDLPDSAVQGEQNHEKILCPHCKRTATNGIKCQGICVADNDY